MMQGPEEIVCKGQTNHNRIRYSRSQKKIDTSAYNSVWSMGSDISRFRYILAISYRIL